MRGFHRLLWPLPVVHQRPRRWHDGGSDPAVRGRRSYADRLVEVAVIVGVLAVLIIAVAARARSQARSRALLRQIGQLERQIAVLREAR